MKERLDKLIAKLPADMDAALLTSDINRLYVSGFDASDDMLFITRDESYFLADFRYIEEVTEKVRHMTPLMPPVSFTETINELIAKHHVKKLGFEDSSLSVYEHGIFSKKLHCDLVPLGNLLSDLRKIKNPDEVQYMIGAQEIADRAFSYITGFIKPGMTERQVALALQQEYNRLGSEGDSFKPIVVSGKKTSLPHGLPSDKIIEKGDFLTMDFGCVVNGYRSDMTRTVAVGFATDEMKKIYDLVLRAQLTALGGIKAGMSGVECDMLARKIINNAGYSKCFGHGLGHSVGLEIHEPPRFSVKCEDKIKSGTVMTVEPGVYLEGKFGVRIEDIVLVTETGIQNFTKSPKDLIVIE